MTFGPVYRPGRHQNACYYAAAKRRGASFAYARRMPVLALHHAQVFYPAGEEARARRFYGDQLGLREVERPRSLQGQAGLWFEVPGGAHVHLAVEPDLALHPRRHFALRVDDVVRMRRALEA